MDKITFILGGARSGKSGFALKLIGRSSGDRVAFIATCEPRDREIKSRIALHKKSRPKHWKTFLAAKRISPLLEKIEDNFDWLLIDCLTLFTSNMILNKFAPRHIEEEIAKTIRLLKSKKTRSVIVSNEVGLGIVPNSKLSRDFRDVAGRVNQAVAAGSDRVFFMVSGIPWRIK